MRVLHGFGLGKEGLVRVWGKRGYFIPNFNGICMGKRIIPTEGFSRARNKGTMMFMHGVCGYNI